MPSAPIRLTFQGSQGFPLAARLDMPATEPLAFALFAHCFTCSKDVFAASRISAALAAHGIATLRFDFTGLGGSDGEFENTNFSSNIADLILAAAHLERHYEAPRLLIGHSLGGAAVLAAAGEIEAVRAVATIGAPADLDHVVKNFSTKLDTIEAEGVANVELAGRSFTIRKQFLEDLASHSLSDRVAKMRRALLVMHAPRDEVVGIDNATRIFIAAKHPKSFISLDDADHFLSRREDVDYAAQVLAAWAMRYIAPEQEPATVEADAAADSGLVTVSETGQGRFQQAVSVGKHRLIADEPASVGGANSGPSPYDFLSIALGACTTMTLRMYAEHKGLALERVSVEVSHGKLHAKDCKDCGEGRNGRIDRFERRVTIVGALSAAERQRLLEIADRCPVHQTLEKSSAIVTQLAEPVDQ